jgi:type IV pilus assembly protein PilF
VSARPLLRIAAMCACAVLALPAAAEESMTRDQRTKAAAVNTQLALTYMKQGELQAAREKIDKALQQNPRTADTQMAAGFVYDRLGE